MKFSVQLPTDRVDRGDEFVSGAAVAEMASAAESAGFDGVYVTDHPIPGEKWLRTGGHHSLDPFVALSFAAAATERLRLITYVLVLPYRNPFLAAKAAASLDVLSGGRLVLGVSAGYLEAEFAAAGADFAARNEATDDAIAALRATWTGEVVSLAGRGYRAEANRALPRPVQQPGPPIWVGGNSKRAIRRAVELAEGWLPFPAPARLATHVRTAALGSLDDLRERLAYARDHAAKVGRTAPLDVSFVPFGFELGVKDAPAAARFAEAVPAYADLGVTWLALALPAESRREWCEKALEMGTALRGKGTDRN
jgi:probable F420-dependent oxidoreductase